MTKRDKFIIDSNLALHKNQSEANLLAQLDDDEAFLLQRFPGIYKRLWLYGKPPETHREAIAFLALYQLWALRDALQNSETPAWKAAVLGIEYWDLVRIYLQPHTNAEIGRAYAKDKQPRRAHDQLCIRVLSHLRRQGNTWKQSLRALEEAAKDGVMIARVVVEQSGKHWTFSRGPKTERFTTATLRDRKFCKA